VSLTQTKALKDNVVVRLLIVCLMYSPDGISVCGARGVEFEGARSVSVKVVK